MAWKDNDDRIYLSTGVVCGYCQYVRIWIQVSKLGNSSCSVCVNCVSNIKCVFITWDGKYKNDFNSFYATNFYLQFFLFFKYNWIWH